MVIEGDRIWHLFSPAKRREVRVQKWIDEAHNEFIEKAIEQGQPMVLLQAIYKQYFANGADGFKEQVIHLYAPNNSEHSLGSISYRLDFNNDQGVFTCVQQDQAESYISHFTFSDNQVVIDPNTDLKKNYSFLQKFFLPDGRYQNDIRVTHANSPIRYLYQPVIE